MKIDDKALIKTKAFINGEWLESDKETFPVINPATGEVIAEVRVVDQKRQIEQSSLLKKHEKIGQQFLLKKEQIYSVLGLS